MGIYDREYYRREGPSFLGSFSGHGQVCKWLILINIVAFVLQLVTRGSAFDLTELAVLDPDAVLHGQVWRLLSYAFLHDPRSLMHILFNMLFLFWFGIDVEEIYGHAEFLAIYLLSALLGGICFFVAQVMHVGQPGVCLGASGAVTTVMVLCAMHFPHRIILLFFILPVPIWLLVVFQVARDLFSFLGGGDTTTAVTVHLTGAAFGFVYHRLHLRMTGHMPSLRGWWKRRSRPSLRIHREPPEEARRPRPTAPVAATRSAEVDEQLEAQLDAVLEKMAQHGQESLTDTERQILFRASEVYRRRRT